MDMNMTFCSLYYRDSQTGAPNLWELQSLKMTELGLSTTQKSSVLSGLFTQGPVNPIIALNSSPEHPYMRYNLNSWHPPQIISSLVVLYHPLYSPLEGAVNQQAAGIPTPKPNPKPTPQVPEPRKPKTPEADV